MSSIPSDERGATVPIEEVSAPEAWLSVASVEDVEYVKASFVPMSDAARLLVARGLLPRATYVLPDGTPMVPRDHAVLLDDADGDPEAVASIFRERFIAAGGQSADAATAYTGWLSGEFGACLNLTTPEAIAAKAGLMSAITALLACPALTEPSWRRALRSTVDALDAHERPFAEHDRLRFGDSLSRDRLITAVRQRYSQLWLESDDDCWC